MQPPARAAGSECVNPPPTSPILISDGERHVLAQLWRGGEARASEVHARTTRGWSRQTVKTFLARLVKKGAVRTTPDGRALRYRAALTRRQYLQAELAGMADDLADGDRVETLYALAGAAGLSDDEVSRLVGLVVRLG